MIINAGQYYNFVFYSGKNLTGKALNSVTSKNQNIKVEWVEPNGKSQIVHNSIFPASSVMQVFSSGNVIV
jgi:hypothetical protein